MQSRGTRFRERECMWLWDGERGSSWRKGHWCEDADGLITDYIDRDIDPGKSGGGKKKHLLKIVKSSSLLFFYPTEQKFGILKETNKQIMNFTKSIKTMTVIHIFYPKITFKKFYFLLNFVHLFI